MSNHPNRGWRGRWNVDLPAREARHGPSGLVVRFRRAADAPAWDGSAVNLEEVGAALIERHGAATAGMIARLMREAGEIWAWHKSREH